MVVRAGYDASPSDSLNGGRDGRQINFYMAPEDEHEFVEFLRTEPGLRLLTRAPVETEAQLDVTALEPPLSKPYWGSLCIYVDRPDFPLILRVHGDGPRLTIDTLRACVVEALQADAGRMVRRSRSNEAARRWLRVETVLAP